MRMSAGIVLLVLAQGLGGCASPAPSAPSPVPQPAQPPVPQPTVQLVMFTDRVSTFSTSDVRDVNDQIVQFNTAGELIWTPDGTHFPGYPVVQESFIREDFSYQVRFGTKDGERRAYFAGHDQDWLYDLEVVAGQLVITKTNVPVPGTSPR